MIVNPPAITMVPIDLSSFQPARAHQTVPFVGAAEGCKKLRSLEHRGYKPRADHNHDNRWTQPSPDTALLIGKDYLYQQWSPSDCNLRIGWFEIIKVAHKAFHPTGPVGNGSIRLYDNCLTFNRYAYSARTFVQWVTAQGAQVDRAGHMTPERISRMGSNITVDELLWWNIENSQQAYWLMVGPKTVNRSQSKLTGRRIELSL